MSNEAIQAQINARGLGVGNEIRTGSGSPAVTNVTQLYIDAGSDLATSVFPVVVQPTATGELLNATGTPNGNIMTQTLVAAASATTATAGGWYRITIVSTNEAIMSSGAYYVPLVTLT